MSGRARAAVLLCAALLGASPRAARADATFEIRSSDAAGVGFNDATAVAAIGGNSGRTLGEQRTIALQHAADLWGQVLDSNVTIVIEAHFEPLGCSADGSATLAFAGTTALETGIDGDGANPDFIYPAALADRLMGEDQLPGEGDIRATFNLDVDAGCLGAGTGWYYGLDARHGGKADFVNVALHELGHGLGVHDYTDHTTGALIGNRPSAYSAHVLDRQSNKRWSEMTNAERLASLSNARNVVWDGEHVIAAAPDLLLAGSPRVSTTPAIAQFTGLAGDATYGAAELSMSVSAELVSAADGCPMDGVSGRIALVRDECAHSVWSAELQRAGAIGVLVAVPFLYVSPPPSFEEPGPETVRIPVLSVSAADADRLRAADEAGSVTVHLSHDAGTLRGSDERGRLLLHATQPATASSIAHWDVLMRPNLLMEPFENAHTVHSVDLTPAMLADIGWARFCGNGRMDMDEECDEGDDNSDDEPDACRASCRLPSCGDAVTDDGEECDQGEGNSDRLADTCRLDCRAARCGDGIRDVSEECDEGDDNSDSVANACRSECLTASCGDDVLDCGEQCDTGDERSATEVDACRLDCMNARCGDGVVDTGEECDQGSANDDQRAGACRKDCRPARCGDGALDPGELCDDGARNSDSVADACRTQCQPARCGDGVKDSAEACDAVDDVTCNPDCTRVMAQMAGAGAAGVGGDGAEAGGGAGATGGSDGEGDGCSCKVAGARGTPRWPGLGLAVLLLVWRVRRRHQ